MSEHDNDGVYWQPGPQDDRRQGDLLYNVPIALMPQHPRFVLGDGEEVATQTFEDYPEVAPSEEIVVEARFGVLGMVITPTCHVSEGEKDEDIVAVVPVQSLNLLIPDIDQARNVLAGNNVPLHMFPLPRTQLGDRVLGFNAVALLDRPVPPRRSAQRPPTTLETRLHQCRGRSEARARRTGVCLLRRRRAARPRRSRRCRDLRVWRDR